MFQKKYIPNYLSFLRLLLVPVYLWVFFTLDQKPVAGAILVLCGLTDALDGHLARKNGWVTDLGKLLDPLADKLASLGALVSLSIAGLLPWFVSGLAVLKEVVMILAAAFILKKRKIVVYSVWYGKLATVLFYVTVLFLHFFPQTILDLPVLKWTLWMLLFGSMALAALLYAFHYLKNLPKSTVKEEN